MALALNTIDIDEVKCNNKTKEMSHVVQNVVARQHFFAFIVWHFRNEMDSWIDRKGFCRSEGKKWPDLMTTTVI